MVREKIGTDRVYMPGYMADFELNEWVFYSPSCWVLTQQAIPDTVTSVRRMTYKHVHKTELDALETIAPVRSICKIQEICIRPDHMKVTTPPILARRRAAEVFRLRREQEEAEKAAREAEQDAIEFAAFQEKMAAQLAEKRAQEAAREAELEAARKARGE